MFALNLVKLFVVAVIVAVLWYGYKWVAGFFGRTGSDKDPDALDMKECTVCGVYRTARGQAACDREDCPYR
ncbi:MAG: hypothetical protein J4G10_03285 [Alphaproteobacteria bacterium]|nr:hypothetical protein [Alphaproteobacteria bacterium]